MYYVYILVSDVDGTLYTGQTRDLVARLKLHNKGRVQSTRRKAPWHLGYFEVFVRRGDAMWREQEFKKKWNSERKRRLVTQFDSLKIQKLLDERSANEPNPLRVDDPTDRRPPGPEGSNGLYEVVDPLPKV